MTAPKALFAAAFVVAAVLMGNLPARAQQATPPPDCNCAPPQDSGKSLADAARETKRNKPPRAKSVITNDDVEVKHGPLPSLNLDGDENSDEIIEAIGNFKTTHTLEETEQVVRDWWRDYDEMLTSAARANTQTNERRNDMYANYACQESQNYEACATHQRTQMQWMRIDQSAMQKNSVMVGRIQQSFLKIRVGLCRYKLQYAWFKIRNANGNGTY